LLARARQGSGSKVKEVILASKEKNKLDSLDLAKKTARFASDKKAENIVIIDMREIVNYADYFVICSGSSVPHLRAIADGVQDSLFEQGIKVRFKQGFDSMSRSRSLSFGIQDASPEQASGRWGLLDMGDVVIHVFDTDSREFFGLEHLWQEAPRVEWEK